MNKKLAYLVLGIIIITGFFLRIYKISEIPASLSPDEAALGYNAYSFLKTGADEHGKFFPLALQSFGDWKLPVYPYSAVLPVAVLGLTETAIRLPSVLAGTIGIVLIYFISLSFFKKKFLALLSSVFFALSPWNIYFSRASYEANLATTLFLVGLLSFIYYFRTNQKNNFFSIIGSILLGLTLFTYHSYILFIPLFVFAGLFVYRSRIKFNKGFIVSLLVLVIFITTSYVSSLFGSGNKASTLLIYNNENIIYNRVEKVRGDGADANFLVEKILYNKFFGGTYQIAQNYINTFSPTFLFDKGGEKLQHNLYGFGNLYLIDAVFLFVGFIMLFVRREKILPILLLWLFIGPIPSSITLDTPNSTRLFLLMPLLTLISAYGAYQIFIFLRSKKFSKISQAILVLLFLLNVIYFFNSYFIHFNIQRIRFWHYGYREAVTLSKENSYDKVVMRGPENFPYIYFLFYTSYDPIKFRNEVKYYPLTSEGFLYVKEFGKYSFPEKINYENLQNNTFYIDDTRTGDKSNSILLPSGDPVLGFMVGK